MLLCHSIFVVGGLALAGEKNQIEKLKSASTSREPTDRQGVQEIPKSAGKTEEQEVVSPSFEVEGYEIEQVKDKSGACKKPKVLITGITEGGEGDISKRVKLLKILKKAGYHAKILTEATKEDKEDYLRLGDLTIANDLEEYTKEAVKKFNPNLWIQFPVGSSVKKIPNLKVPIFAIPEYNAMPNEHPMKGKNRRLPADTEIYECGMSGLGLLLKKDLVNKEAFENPTKQLTLLPDLYQRALYNKIDPHEKISEEDFKGFDSSNDFYFAYASRQPSFRRFMGVLLDLRRIFPGDSQKASMTFFFMGDIFNEIQKRDQTYLEGKGVKSIRFVRIIEESAEQKEIVLQEKGIEVHIVSGRIKNKFVIPLLVAGKEIFTTGDESTAEAYSAGRVPFLYEYHPHKEFFRNEQLLKIYESIAKAYREKKIPDLSKSLPENYQLSLGEFRENQEKFDEELLKKIKDMLLYPAAMIRDGFGGHNLILMRLKRIPGVEDALKDHLKEVHTTLDFEKNLLELMENFIESHCRQESE